MEVVKKDKLNTSVQRENQIATQLRFQQHLNPTSFLHIENVPTLVDFTIRNTLADIPVCILSSVRQLLPANPQHQGAAAIRSGLQVFRRTGSLCSLLHAPTQPTE